MRRKRMLPTDVFLICKTGAYLVGGCVNYILGKTDKINDYDLIVPPEKWYYVSLLIPNNAKLNKHGGLKFKDNDGNIVDIWPCSIGQYLIQSSYPVIYDYMSQKLFTAKIEEC